MPDPDITEADRRYWQWLTAPHPDDPGGPEPDDMALAAYREGLEGEGIEAWLAGDTLARRVYLDDVTSEPESRPARATLHRVMDLVPARPSRLTSLAGLISSTLLSGPRLAMAASVGLLCIVAFQSGGATSGNRATYQDAIVAALFSADLGGDG